jgi:hypothetical protein
MTPQSSFTIVAPVDMAQIGALRALLDMMNMAGTPGMADPSNGVVPFGDFGTLHYARIVIIDDHTLSDFAKWCLEVPKLPIALAFLGDCDGSADDLLAALVRDPKASTGLRRIFRHCTDYDANADLLTWMKQREHRPAATYVNWIGRTVDQIRKEAALRTALQNELRKYQEIHGQAGKNPQAVRVHLLQCADRHRDLIPAPARTRLTWRLRDFLHFAIVPLAVLAIWLLSLACLVLFPVSVLWVAVASLALGAAGLVWLVRIVPVTLAILAALGLLLIPVLPLLLIPALPAALVFFAILRHYEKSEVEIECKPSPGHDRALTELEDHDVTNQFTVVGSVKPSAFRRVLLTVILWFINYGARHVYNRGFLARIRTIHFARWVFIDGKRRVLFVSNYDGSRQAYMDDFINKAGWGLNLAFGSGLGYPRTNWLIKNGAKNELRFKDTNRRHQMPTQVWYKAYPGLTAFDLTRNTRVREGVERRHMTDEEVRAWLRDL